MSDQNSDTGRETGGETTVMGRRSFIKQATLGAGSGPAISRMAT